MSFWDTFDDGGAEATGVSAVLVRDSFTVEDLLDEDDVLQECASSSALVAALEKNVDQLVAMVIKSPSDERETRFSFLACEILRFGHESIEKVLLSPGTFALLCSLIEATPDEAHPLNAVAAEHFGKVFIRLLDSPRTKDATLGQLNLKALLAHLENASILNVALAVVVACTEEFERKEGDGDNSNCRLQRLLSPQRAQWLVEHNLPAQIFEKLLHPKAALRAHALELLLKLDVFVQPDDPVALQFSSASFSVSEATETLVEAAHAVSVLSKYRSKGDVEFLEQFCRASLEQGTTKTLVAAAQLLEGFLTHHKATSTVAAPLVEQLVAQMFAHENCTILAVAVMNSVRQCLVDFPEIVLTDAVFGRVVETFLKVCQEWPRNALFGLLISALEALQTSPEAAEFRKRVAWSDKVEPELETCLKIQNTPLYGDRDPDRYIAKLDLKGGLDNINF